MLHFMIIVSEVHEKSIRLFVCNIYYMCVYIYISVYILCTALFVQRLKYFIKMAMRFFLERTNCPDSQWVSETFMSTCSLKYIIIFQAMP